MKKIAAVLLLTACSTTPKSKPDPEPMPTESSRVTVIGSGTPKVKSPSVADLTLEDWTLAQGSCVTHLYQCEYDEKGKVTQLKSLDQSEPTFHEFTEEALKDWRFEGGKSGRCFAQMIYEREMPTRVLIVPQDMAESMITTLQKNRAALPKTPPGKSLPTVLRQPRLDVPKEMAMKRQSGYIILNFDIDPEGVPTNIKVVDEAPAGSLETRARAAIKQWRYAKLADEPSSFRNSTATMTVLIEGGVMPSSCDLGLKLNRLAQAGSP